MSDPYLTKTEDAVHASTDAGVLVLGVRADAAVATTDTAGDYAALTLNSAGQLRVMLGSQNGGNAVISPLEAQAAQPGISVTSQGMQFNGANWDRVRGTESRILVAAGARTTAPAPADQVNYNGTSLMVFVRATAMTGAGLTVVIEGKDPAGLEYYPLLTSPVIVAPTPAGAPLILQVNPRLAAVANSIAAVQLPRIFRVRYIHGDAASVNYSVGADILP